MAYIITSKTRARIMSKPGERVKALSELRCRTAERHGVFSVRPVNGLSEEEVHAELDRQGSQTQEVMALTRERERRRLERRREEREAARRETTRERLSVLERRDAAVRERARAERAGSKAKRKRR